jgi:hypothetical protein
LGLGRHHHEVKACFAGHIQGLPALNNADLASVWAYDPKVAVPKAPFVDRRSLVTLRGSAESCYRRSPRRNLWVLIIQSTSIALDGIQSQI